MWEINSDFFFKAHRNHNLGLNDRIQTVLGNLKVAWITSEISRDTFSKKCKDTKITILHPPTRKNYVKGLSTKMPWSKPVLEESAKIYDGVCPGTFPLSSPKLKYLRAEGFKETRKAHLDDRDAALFSEEIIKSVHEQAGKLAGYETLIIVMLPSHFSVSDQRSGLSLQINTEM